VLARLLLLLPLPLPPRHPSPSFTAFLTPEALQQLVDAFAIKPADTGDAAADLKLMMGNK
jgi:hypothetical protein